MVGIPFAHAKHLTILYLGVGPAALAYLGWCYVLSYMPASRAALFLYALPLVSTALGQIVLHETPKPTSLIGGLVALSGAMIAGYCLKSE